MTKFALGVSAMICTTSAVSAPGTYPVSLMVNNAAAGCPSGCDFNYNAAISPTITNVNPGTVSGAATQITLTGTLFPTDTSKVAITIGGVVCVVDSASVTEIVCTVGYVPVGDAAMVVVISDVGEPTFTTAGHKNIWSSKDITSVTPNMGSKKGGTEVTIAGNGFHLVNTKVMIKDKECKITSITISEIKCTTASINNGEYTLQVTSGIHSYVAQTYTYAEDVTPSTRSVTPVSGKSGDAITIGGVRFSDTMEDVTVTIDGESCTVTSASETSVVCNVGAHAAGTYPVLVHVKGKGLSGDNVGFTYGLSITSTSPATSGFGGGRTLTIAGIGFGTKDTTTVTVCDNACPILSISATTIECDVPGNSAADATLACDVVVTVKDVPALTQAGAWTYDRTKTPTITSVSPQRGGTGGGTILTIAGADFSATGNVVSIAGTPCVVQTQSATEITCRTGSRPTTVKSKVRVEVGGDRGIATQDNADYFYVDLWSSQFTWGGNPPPVEGDLVVIETGQTVMLDIDTPVLKMVLIQGGGLMFDDEKPSITLNAEHILIVEAGFLQVGTEEKPYQNKATIVMHGHVRSKELPLYGAKTLAVRNGTLDLHGKHVKIPWTHLAATVAPGVTQMKLMLAVTWQVGDKIVVASTGHRHAQRENEEFTITAVSADGLTLDFTPAAQYEHISEVQTIGGVTLETRAEVGMITRNVLVRGSLQEEWTETIPACATEFDTNQFATQTCFQGKFGEETGSDQFGVQIMLSAAKADTHATLGRIEYVEITHAGQAFHLGRYPIHFHLNGDVTGNYVRGCAIHHTFNRAVTIHAVHGLLVEHNVAYNIMGHAYFLEDGIETKNIIQYNLAIFVRSSNSLLNVDVTPAAYWITNPDNIVRHNAAAGGSHFGYWYNAPAHPGGPSYTNQICPRNIPVLEFKNNTAHTMGWYGLWIFPVYYPKEIIDGKSCGERASTPAVFNGLTAWRTERGAEGVEVGNVQFINFLMADNLEAGVEFQTTNDAWGGPLVKDTTIIGWSDLTAATKADGCTAAGLKLPKSNYLTVDGIKFINFDQPRCSAVKSCSHCKVDQGGFSARFKNIAYHNSPNKAAWQWEHEGWIVDVDGSYTTKGAGSANSKVLPKNPNLAADKCEFGNAAFEVGVGDASGKPGAICDSTVEFHRMAFNNAKPTSLKYKDALFTNSHGTSHVPYKKKRITHPTGWMVTLIKEDAYKMFFWDADHLTNISYSARFYDFEDGDFVLMKHNLTQKPDRFAITGAVSEPAGAVPTYGANVNGDWFFDETESELTYLVSGKADSVPTNKDVTLNVYQCFFADCIPPPPVILDAPLGARPDVVQMWSDIESWKELESGFGSGEGVLPLDGADVMIKPGVWMVADVDALPKMGKLYIYGVLELDPTKDFVLEATHIIIQGGRLIAGFPDAPFTQSGQITLAGTHATEEITLPRGPVLGSKALGVFGGLDLHGKARSVYWTHLASTMAAGANTLTVTEDTDWKVDEEIVVTTTDFDAWHTETFKITAVSGRTFTVNSTAQYKHSGVTHNVAEGNINSYDIRAEVGLLTRNIKIVGKDYNNLFAESFGARVLVGAFNQEVDGVTKEYRGYGRLSNVEFYHSGQEGHVASYDPRYSLTYLNIGEVDAAHPASSVTGCSFHSGFSPAMGFYGANGLEIKDNVAHHVVGQGIVDYSSNNKFTHNLVALVIFPGMYQNRNEIESLLWEGGFEVQNAKNPVLINNAVAGSERVGFKIKGEACLNGAAPDPTTAWSGNVAHGALHGVQIFPESQDGCSRISNFVLYRNFDFGIYVQAGSGIEVSNVVFADNHAGILAMIKGPAALEHKTSTKSVKVKDSLFVGMSPDFECGVEDAVVPAVASHPKSHSNKVKPVSGGHAGFVCPTFMSGGNGAPFFKWSGVHNYPALSGYSHLKDVVFSDFGEKCSKRSFMLMTNEGSGDFQHPVQTEGILMSSTVDPNSLVFMHRPPISLINPADCVDMACDAQKKALIRDLDGSLVGAVGTVVPASEFEWDGDARHGLGDYRIPTTLLTNPLTGARIAAADKCPNKGIYGVHSGSCTWQNDWQAYKCTGIDHMIMVFESLDGDTEVRRLSPQALYTDGYVDLVNGPQDHGWCHGYTCQERISTFYTMVATGQEYEVHFASTNPQRMRLHLLNAVASQKVVVGIYYTNPQRLDVYYDGAYVRPTNGKLNEAGKLIWENLPNTDYKPSLSSSVFGENYFNRDTSTLYILVSGATPVDIVTTPVIMVSFGVPAQTVGEFFGANLLTNLALLLNIDPSKIRIVDIVSEDGLRRRRSAHIIDYDRRRKRRQADKTTEIIFEIGDPPSESDPTDTTVPDGGTPVETPPAEKKLEFETLTEITATIANEQQSGTLNEALKVEVTTLAVTEPEPAPVDPTGGVKATEETGGPTTGEKTFAEAQAEEEAVRLAQVASVVLLVPSTLTITTQATGASENQPFSVQPKIEVLDDSGTRVNQLGASANPWRLQASIRSGTGDNAAATLVGTTEVPFENGFATFTDLAINKKGSGFMLDFTVIYPDSSTLKVSSSVGITITTRAYKAEVPAVPSDVKVDEAFAITVAIKDLLAGGLPQGIADKGLAFKATASIFEPSNYPGSLSGTLEATFDLVKAEAEFNNLMINAKGYSYIIQFRVVTVPSSSYDFTAKSGPFDVKVKGEVAPTGAAKTYTVRFNAVYDTVAFGKEAALAINVRNKLTTMYPGNTFGTPVISKGSIIAAQSVQTNDFNAFQTALLDDLSNGRLALTFNGDTLTAENSLMVDGQSVETVAGGNSNEIEPSDSAFPGWVIAIIVIVAIVMLLVIIFVVYFICCRKKDNKISQTETIPLEDERAHLTGAMAVISANSSLASVRKGTDSPMMTAITDDEAVSLALFAFHAANSSKKKQDLDDMRVGTPASLRVDTPTSPRRSNTPRRTPEIAVTSLPPGFTEGQKENALEDRTQMSLMGRNDADGTFTKLAILSVNLVGAISDLRVDINTALLGSTWKEKFILLKETLKDIQEAEEDKLVVSEIYSSDCVLIRWVSPKQDDEQGDAPAELDTTAIPEEKPRWKPTF